MNSLKNGNWSTKRPFVTALVCLALLLLSSFAVSAQTKITAKPDTVTDPAKPRMRSRHGSAYADKTSNASWSNFERHRITVMPNSSVNYLIFTNLNCLTAGDV